MSTKEYRTISEARGGLLVTKGTSGVAFGDRVQIRDHAGTKRNGQVIRCSEGEALILVFEGSDAAGKGGSIRRIAAAIDRAVGVKA